MLKISIIIATYNSEKTLKQTLDSIRYQTYENIETIVIDGLSTDDTLKIVKEYSDVVKRYISEKDTGIYNAFNKGINFLYRKNGSGKTNIVEAIYFFYLTKSFRTSNYSQLIKFNNEFSVINGIFNEGLMKYKIDIQISKNGKIILVNNKNITKISELSNLINIIYFIPKEVNLFKESPKARRSFLDLSISKFDKDYLSNLQNYEKVLKERNDLLKQENFDDNLLKIYDEQMATFSFYIYKIRKKYISKLNNHLSKIYTKISGNNEKVTLHYVPYINESENYLSVFKQKYSSNLENDKKYQRTTEGIHLEDIYLTLNDKNLSYFGSQGENRTAILTLKLTPYFLIEDENKKPIIILDDVLSELDSTRKLKFIDFLKDFKQVFITSTNKINDSNLTYYLISDKGVSIN